MILSPFYDRMQKLQNNTNDQHLSIVISSPLNKITMPTSTLSPPEYIEARPSEKAGLGLFTSKSIPAGDLILEIKRPLITELDSARLADTCEWCLKHVQGDGEDRPKLRACTGCKIVRYCSKVGLRI